MKFKTKISKTENGMHSIRGHDLVELIKNRSFADIVFLLLRGDLPKENEKKLFEAMLVAATENGIEAPSLYVPRIVAASGNDMHTALAAGMLAIGEKHGGATEKAAKFFADHIKDETPAQVVAAHLTEIIPGYGHKVYKEGDPRTAALYQKTKELGLATQHFDYAFALEQELEKQKGKKIPLNIDGAIASLMLDLGFDRRLGKAFFLISRIVGMSAHVLEEMQQGNSYYRLEDGDVEYEK